MHRVRFSCVSHCPCFVLQKATPQDPVKMFARALHECDYQNANHIVSHFHTLLAEAFKRASEDNYRQLALVFPRFAATYNCWKESSDNFYRAFNLPPPGTEPDIEDLACDEELDDSDPDGEAITDDENEP